MTSRADREQHVARMLASSRLEGFEADDTHKQLLQEYIEGTASLEDLLEHARAYAHYRSRPSDDGGTYYLLPRDSHLLRARESAPKPIQLDVEEKEQDAARMKESIDPEVSAMVDAFFAQLASKNL
jgi:hypothetical protein